MIQIFDIVDDLKVMLELKDDSKDELLHILVKKSIADIKIECNTDFEVDGVEKIPAKLESVIGDLAMFRYGKLGAEGLVSESLGDKSVSYMADIPETIKRRLYPFRQMRVW